MVDTKTKMFALLAFVGSIAQATPVAKASGFSSVCSDISMDGSFWLHATCPDDSGASVNSTIYLPRWIENNDGQLVWQDNGAFSDTCSNYALLNSGGTLKAYCTHAYGTPANHSRDSTINLEEHIANYNGHLLSNLDGTPDTPTNSSTVPIPTDMTLDINLAFGDRDCEQQNSVPPITAPKSCSCTYGCYGWNGIQITTNPGWLVEGYTTKDCSGTPSYSSSSISNQCERFNETLVYFKYTPLWNWD